MHILVIIALLAACFLSACSPVAPPGQEAEVSSPSPQATEGPRLPRVPGLSILGRFHRGTDRKSRHHSQGEPRPYDEECDN